MDLADEIKIMLYCIRYVELSKTSGYKQAGFKFTLNCALQPTNAHDLNIELIIILVM